MYGAVARCKAMILIGALLLVTTLQNRIKHKFDHTSPQHAGGRAMKKTIKKMVVQDREELAEALVEQHVYKGQIGKVEEDAAGLAVAALAETGPAAEQVAVLRRAGPSAELVLKEEQAAVLRKNVELAKVRPPVSFPGRWWLTRLTFRRGPYVGLVYQEIVATNTLLIKSWKALDEFGEEAILPQQVNYARAKLGDKITFDVEEFAHEGQGKPRPLAKNVIIRWRGTAHGEGMEHSPALIDVRTQVLYYISDANLRIDPFFQNIIAKTEGGWISTEFLLLCRRMKQLGASTRSIMDGLRDAPGVEVRDIPGKEAIRRTSPPPMPDVVAMQSGLPLFAVAMQSAEAPVQAPPPLPGAVAEQSAVAPNAVAKQSAEAPVQAEKTHAKVTMKLVANLDMNRMDERWSASKKQKTKQQKVKKRKAEVRAAGGRGEKTHQQVAEVKGPEPPEEQKHSGPILDDRSAAKKWDTAGMMESVGDLAVAKTMLKMAGQDPEELVEAQGPKAGKKELKARQDGQEKLGDERIPPSYRILGQEKLGDERIRPSYRAAAVANLEKLEAEQAKREEEEDSAEEVFRLLPVEARIAAASKIGEQSFPGSSWRARLAAAQGVTDPLSGDEKWPTWRARLAAARNLVAELTQDQEETAEAEGPEADEKERAPSVAESEGYQSSEEEMGLGMVVGQYPEEFAEVEGPEADEKERAPSVAETEGSEYSEEEMGLGMVVGQYPEELAEAEGPEADKKQSAPAVAKTKSSSSGSSEEQMDWPTRVKMASKKKATKLKAAKDKARAKAKKEDEVKKLAKKAAGDKVVAEKVAANRVAQKKALVEAEQAAAERAAAEKAAAEKAAAKAAADKVAAEQAAAMQAAAEQAAAEKAAEEAAASTAAEAAKPVYLGVPVATSDNKESWRSWFSMLPRAAWGYLGRPLTTGNPGDNEKKAVEQDEDDANEQQRHVQNKNLPKSWFAMAQDELARRDNK